jgi:hypothetical protein
VVKVTFNLGNSSSNTSAGSCRINLPSAVNPNAYVEALTSGDEYGGSGSVWKARRLACMVVRPYTGSILAVSASRMEFVASRTCQKEKNISITIREYIYIKRITLVLLQYRI